MERCETDFITDAVNKYADMIFRIAYQNLKNRADAEDAVQEVFVKLISAPKLQFDDGEHVKAWLIRVTVNLCRDFKKSAWHRKTGELKKTGCAFTKKQSDVLEEVLRLPAKYRNVIYLYYYEQYTIQEIAGILNVKKNTVDSQLLRARKKLKDILTQGGNESDS